MTNFNIMWQVRKPVWKRIEDEKDMPSHLLYSVRTTTPSLLPACGGGV